ncbi:MAG TPA: hypothetical protein DD714_06460, partial [Candidatus Omnitrophica bacterium]|nr:hypothetical protein [Candidatus Omnitrophota bacterium]
WRQDYNTVRPHSSLGDRTPTEFAQTEPTLHSSTTQGLYLPVA